MQLSQKLAISARKGYISLFDEGLFLRIYNQSAYIVTVLQQQNLTLSRNVIKKLQNRPIVYCAFPKKNLPTRFAETVKTPWGFEIAGQFDLTDYENWFKWALNSTAEKTTESNHEQYHQAIEQPQNKDNDNKNETEERVSLNSQQIAFIKSWQRGIYPKEVEEGFMDSLKKQIP